MEMSYQYSDIGRLQYQISSANQINAYHSFKDHVLGISDIAINHLLKNNFFSASYDNNINSYDYQKCKLLGSLKGHTQGVWTLDHSKKESLLLSGSNDNSIILWDTKSNKAVNTLKEHDEVVYDVKFSEKGNLFASCSKGKICLWDIKNLKKPLYTLNDQKKEYVYSLSFVNNDAQLCSGLIDGSLILVNTDDMKIIKQTLLERKFDKPAENQDPGNSIYSIAVPKESFKSQSNEFLLGTSEGTVIQCALNGSDISQLNDKVLSNFPITCVNTNYDNSLIVAGTKDHIGMVFKYSFAENIDHVLVGHHDVITAADFLENDVIVTSSYDCTVKLWKLN